MKINPAPHLKHPWRVHTLAADFELLDVWELAIAGAPHDRFDRLFELIAEKGLDHDSAIANALFFIREQLGKIFKWDDVAIARPIPGCTETSLSDRLSTDDRARTRAKPNTPVGTNVTLADIRYVYRFDDEALLEISNATIHALIHISWAKDDAGRARIAIYIKSRGAMSRVYMAAIEPFRKFFIYPAWTRSLARSWHHFLSL